MSFLSDMTCYPCSHHNTQERKEEKKNLPLVKLDNLGYIMPPKKLQTHKKKQVRSSLKTKEDMIIAVSEILVINIINSNQIFKSSKYYSNIVDGRLTQEEENTIKMTCCESTLRTKKLKKQNAYKANKNG